MQSLLIIRWVAVDETKVIDDLTRAPVAAYTLNRHWLHLVAVDISKQLASGWPLLHLRDLWLQPCVTLWSGILVTKFGGHWGFPNNLNSGQLCLTTVRPLIPAMHYALVGVLYAKFGSLSNLTSGWPQLTPAWPLTLAMHYTLVRGFSYQIW